MTPAPDATSPASQVGMEGEARNETLIERLETLSGLEPGWYANVGKRTGERCCAAMREAAAAIRDLEAENARLRSAPIPAVQSGAVATIDGEPVALPSISVDGPHRPCEHRLWLARQLLDSRMTDDEAYSTVAFSPAITDCRAPQSEPLPGGVGEDWQSVAMWMGFAASVIKAGESWTDQCQREYDEAKRSDG